MMLIYIGGIENMEKIEMENYIRQLTPEQLAHLKVENDEILFKTNELIMECEIILNS